MIEIVRYISLALFLLTLFQTLKAQDDGYGLPRSLGVYSRVGPRGEREMMLSENGVQVGVYRRQFHQPRIPIYPEPHPPTAKPHPPTTKPHPPTAKPYPPTAKPYPPTTKPPVKKPYGGIQGRNQGVPEPEADSGLLGGLLGGVGGGGLLSGLLGGLLGGIGR